jgi:hypothetical protein
MKKENNTSECCQEKIIVKKHHCHNSGGSNAIYGLSVIGALFYFLQNAPNFGSVLIGIGKAIFWPAILMFKFLTFLQM